MEILFGIIFFQMLIIGRCRMGINESVPYVSVFIISMLLVAYVMLMIFTYASPKP